MIKYSPALLDRFRCEKCRHVNPPRVKYVEAGDCLDVSCHRCGWTIAMQSAAKEE